MAAENITIRKGILLSEFLSQIDINEADAEFARDVSENDNSIYSIFCDNRLVGAAQIIAGGTAFLYVYIFPAYRNHGYGKATVALLEQQLSTPRLNKIMTCYHSNDIKAVTFAARCGYIKEFASDYMVYSGPLFELETIPVRRYQDADYPAAHFLYAEAFHLMRLSTGWFPNSVPEEPNEQMRQYWADTDKERLVYLLDDEIVGYAHIENNEISSVSVKSTHQGKGIGEKFVKYIINQLLSEGHKEISLSCVVGNLHARHLYDRLGFVQIYCNDYAVKKVRQN